jgi:hypothetical protein
MADQSRLPIFLTAFPSAIDFYPRFGFKYVSHFDTDLSEWAGKYRGYGVFRSSAEVREVRGFD